MPPKKSLKRTSSAAAAAAASESDSDLSDVPSESDDSGTKPNAKKKAAAPVKKQKKQKEEVAPLDPSLPINPTIPEDLAAFARPKEGATRIACWNVCSLNASVKKGFLRYVEAEDADILVLSETKTGEPNIPELTDRYPYRYWGVDPKKGYAGTAILSKIEPISVTIGLPTSEDPQSDSAGRLVTLEFPNTYVIGAYVVNAGEKLKSMDKKIAWNIAFEKYLRELDAKKPVIWTGDINSVRNDRDIRNWKTNYNKSAGCTDIEINALEAQLNPDPESGHKKFLDVWRERNPDAVGYYTYFSYRFQCRRKGIGWRIDYFFLSERIAAKAIACEIRLEIYGASDHVPLALDYEGPL